MEVNLYIARAIRFIHTFLPCLYGFKAGTPLELIIERYVFLCLDVTIDKLCRMPSLNRISINVR